MACSPTGLHAKCIKTELKKQAIKDIREILKGANLKTFQLSESQRVARVF